MTNLKSSLNYSQCTSDATTRILLFSLFGCLLLSYGRCLRNWNGNSPTNCDAHNFKLHKTKRSIQLKRKKQHNQLIMLLEAFPLQFITQIVFRCHWKWQNTFQLIYQSIECHTNSIWLICAILIIDTCICYE